MDKQKSIEISKRVMAALAPLAKEFKVEFSDVGGTYSAGCCMIKLQVAEINPEGRAETPERELFRNCITRAFPGLKPTDLDRNFRFQGKGGLCRVVGLTKQGRMIFEREGKEYVLRYEQQNMANVVWVP